MKKVLIYITTIIIVTSCSSPLDKKYSKETFKVDIQKIVESKAVDSLGMQILVGVAMADAFGASGQLEGKTYREIIEVATKKNEEEKALADKAAKEEAIRIEKLNKTLTVAVFEKGFSEVNYQSYITYKFVFENKTDKEIRALNGTVIFTDLFDKEINRLDVTYDQSILAKGTKKWDAQTRYNQFLEEDQILMSKKLSDLKIVWIPKKILFSDGSSIE